MIRFRLVEQWTADPDDRVVECEVIMSAGSDGFMTLDNVLSHGRSGQADIDLIPDAVIESWRDDAERAWLSAMESGLPLDRVLATLATQAGLEVIV